MESYGFLAHHSPLNVLYLPSQVEFIVSPKLPAHVFKGSLTWPAGQLFLNFVFNYSLKTAKAQRLVAHLEALAVVGLRGMFSVERNTEHLEGVGLQTLVPKPENSVWFL